MPLELVEDALGDPRNARFLALASDLAYYDQDKARIEFKEQLGLDATLYSVGNTQAYVATNDNHIVVAFRGTEAPTSIEGLKDWLLTDACNLLILPEGRLGSDFAAAGVGARLHQGFINALGDIWEPVCEAIQAEMKKAKRPLWLTGHSLGGALALLAAWLCTRRFINVHQIYTFGAPMVGNAEATAAFDSRFAKKLFRYVNGPDPIPRLPTISLIANAFGHCQKQVDLGEAPEDSFWSEMGKRTMDGILNLSLMTELWEGIKARVGAHAMTEYLTQVTSKLDDGK
jgi:hypothetical protein